MGNGEWVPLGSAVVKKKNHQSFQPKAASNKNLETRQQGIAEWKRIYLDQLLAHPFFCLSFQFQSAANLKD